MKLSRAGENNPMFGRKHTDDAKKRMSESHRKNRLIDSSAKAEIELTKIMNEVVKELRKEYENERI